MSLSKTERLSGEENEYLGQRERWGWGGGCTYSAAEVDGVGGTGPAALLPGIPRMFTCNG